MKVTPDIVRCDLIGTEAKVARSRHQDYAGIRGRVVDETRNTLTIQNGKTERTVLKESAVFHFAFSDGTVVEINGRLLVGKPEDRLKKHVRRLW
jgi:ribonuclease P protein subunit POP4